MASTPGGRRGVPTEPQRRSLAWTDNDELVVTMQVQFGSLVAREGNLNRATLFDAQRLLGRGYFSVPDRDGDLVGFGYARFAGADHANRCCVQTTGLLLPPTRLPHSQPRSQ
jgi:hypothetical protein